MSTEERLAAVEERLATVERRDARFDELRVLILDMRDDLRGRIEGSAAGLRERLDRIERDQISEDDWLARLAELRALIEQRH